MYGSVTEKMASVLLLLFPAMLMTVPDGGSTILVLLIIVSSIGLLLSKNSIPLSKNEKHLLVIISAYILIYIFNVWLFNSSISELDNTSRFLLLLPIFFYLRKSTLNHKYFYYGILLGALSCISIASYEIFYLGMHRSHSVQKVVSFGGLSIILAMMCFSIGIFSTTLHTKILFYSGTVLAIWASILSGSRGTWLAILPCLILWIYLNPKKWSVKARGAIAIVSCLIIIVSYNLPVVKPRVDRAINEFNLYYTDNAIHTSLGYRLEAWHASTITIIDNPLFGIGEGNFNNAMQQLSDQGLVNPDFPNKINHVHNGYISALLHQGVPGLLSLLLLFLIPLIVFSKALNLESNERRIIPAIGISLIVSTMTFSLSDVYFLQHQYTIFFAAFLYVLYAFMNTHSTDNLKKT